MRLPWEHFIGALDCNADRRIRRARRGQTGASTRAGHRHPLWGQPGGRERSNLFKVPT